MEVGLQLPLVLIYMEMSALSCWSTATILSRTFSRAADIPVTQSVLMPLQTRLRTSLTFGFCWLNMLPLKLHVPQKVLLLAQPVAIRSASVLLLLFD